MNSRGIRIAGADAERSFLPGWMIFIVAGVLVLWQG